LGAPRQRADVETLPSGRAPFCRAICCADAEHPALDQA